MAGGGGDVTNTQRTELDPRMNSALWGTETRQLRSGVEPIYGQGAWVNQGSDNGGSWDPLARSINPINPDSDYEITRTPGLVDYFQQQFQAGQGGANYAGMTDVQRNALNAQADFLNSPAAMAGYNAQNAVGNYLVNGLLGSGQSGGGGSSGSGTATSGGFGSTAGYNIASGGGAGSGYAMYGNSAMPTATAVPQVQSDQGYQDAMQQVLSGTPNNPYLSQIAGDIANTTTQNFQRNVLPGIQAGATLAGGYGGSRQGIAEGLAMSDLNNQILQSQNQLYGTAYENAAARQAQMTGQLSAQNLAASQANATNALAGQQQANDWLLGNRGIDAQMAQAAASQANASASRDLGFAQLAHQQQQAQIQNALTGAGLLSSSSQIPLSNMQGLYNVGTTFQTEQQNQLNAPMQNLQQYSQNLLPWSGLGATTTQTQPGGGGNPISGAMGGALMGGTLGSTLGGAANGAAWGPYGALIGAGLGLLSGMR